jgi:hypothetical protein
VNVESGGTVEALDERLRSKRMVEARSGPLCSKIRLRVRGDNRSKISLNSFCDFAFAS